MEAGEEKKENEVFKVLQWKRASLDGGVGSIVYIEYIKSVASCTRYGLKNTESQFIHGFADHMERVVGRE